MQFIKFFCACLSDILYLHISGHTDFVRNCCEFKIKNNSCVGHPEVQQVFVTVSFLSQFQVLYKDMIMNVFDMIFTFHTITYYVLKFSAACKLMHRVQVYSY